MQREKENTNPIVRKSVATQLEITPDIMIYKDIMFYMFKEGREMLEH